MKPLFIGSLAVDPPLLQAPMAGYTNFAFRQILRRLGGVGLPATEMVSARGFLYGELRRGELPGRLWGVAEEPRPLAVQIWDNDPAALAEVGRRLVETFRPSVVDINFGCPARDVSEKARSGSYLLRYPERVGEIVERVAAACRPAPVTAKIRLGATRDTINAIDVAQAIEGAGGQAVTVHGRTAADMFRGRANWDEIARVKPHLARIPLIGNGDLRSPAEVVAAFDRYGVDGAMIGRAALGRPWLFAQAAAALRGEPAPPDPSPAEQRQLLTEHFHLVVERFGPAKATILMRSYACCYGEGQPGARAFRRDVARAATPDEFLAIVDRAFPAAPSVAHLQD
ncbi:MAG: tRNA-dihydrouridine synthase [Thermoguttaceae bacterium]